MPVITDVVGLRDTIREQGDLVKLSSLEEFGVKYVQAIGYEKKSEQYEGDPISVLLLQLDSDHQESLDEAAAAIVDICRPYEGVDVFVARDDKEAEHFW
jgi:FAD/FMN-containing dehydrogenase